MTAVTVGTRGLRLPGGEELRLLSGEVHPWRVPPECWGAALDAVVDLGFRVVSAYVPWVVHEQAPGVYDFTGERDVSGFCQAAADRGLRVVLRVGPDCGAELPGSGWPRRVLDDPRCQARRSDGRPYLLVTATHHCFPPSYASAVVLDEVRRWYDAVAAVVAPLQAPAGPVVAVQVDNEMAYHFQAHSYALDYHPAALTQYREFLVRRYGSLAELDRAYGRRHESFDAVEPPTDGTPDPDPWRTDWVAWREEHLRRSMRTLAEMLRERGVDRVPLVHNHHPRTEPPIDIGAMERHGGIDLCGGDIYVTRHGAKAAAGLVRHLAGSSRLPYMAELGAGWLALPWLLPMALDPVDEEFVARRVMLGGARAANVFMLVERDRWYGSPVSARGEIREERAGGWRRLTDLLDRLALEDMERWAPVLVVENRSETRRIAARDTLGAAVPSFTQAMPLDPRLTRLDHPDTDLLREWERGLTAALDGAGIDYDRASSTSLPNLARYSAVVVPTLDTFDPDVWQVLHDAAASGTRVAVGPRVPGRDETGRSRRFDRGRVEVLDRPASVTGIVPTPPFRCSQESVELVAWFGSGRTVVAAFNHSDAPVDAEIAFEGSAKFVSHRGDEVLEGVSLVEARLDGWGVGIWEVAR